MSNLDDEFTISCNNLHMKQSGMEVGQSECLVMVVKSAEVIVNDDY